MLWSSQSAVFTADQAVALGGAAVLTEYLRQRGTSGSERVSAGGRSAGSPCAFYPKFHRELNFIERHWCEQIGLQGGIVGTACKYYLHPRLLQVGTARYGRIPHRHAMRGGGTKKAACSSHRKVPRRQVKEVSEYPACSPLKGKKEIWDDVHPLRVKMSPIYWHF